MISSLSANFGRTLIWILALALMVPVVVMLVAGFSAPSDLFSHLWQTVLPDYLSNTLWLGFWVVILSLLFGLPPALAITFTNLKSKSFLRWALLLPLAMPAYLIAYLYTDLFDYAGPVQRWLRVTFEWQSPQDYWFFDMRTLGGAAVVIALVLYPYIYMLARTAFENQDKQLIKAGRVLGLSPLKSLFKIALPLARPAIAVAASLVLMETLADFATVQYFAVNTLTTAVYDTWLGYGDLPAANALASILMFMVLMVVVLEMKSRAGIRHQTNQPNQYLDLIQLSNLAQLGLVIYCWMLVILGFALPFIMLIDMTLSYFDSSQLSSIWQSGVNSLEVSLWVATLAVLLALSFSFYQRFTESKKSGLPLKISGFGYAIPGTVLAMAMMATFAPIDHFINDIAKSLELTRPGLILSGTSFAIVFALIVRFAAIANGTVNSGLEQIPLTLDKASKSLGIAKAKMLWQVHRPLLTSSMLVAWLLVFVEAMKELPAVLLLRPFNFETLSTQVYQMISDERLEQGAIGAVFIVLFGLLPIIWLNKEKSHV